MKVIEAVPGAPQWIEYFMGHVVGSDIGGEILALKALPALTKEEYELAAKTGDRPILLFKTRKLAVRFAKDHGYQYTRGMLYHGRPGVLYPYPMWDSVEDTRKIFIDPLITGPGDYCTRRGKRVTIHEIKHHPGRGGITEFPAKGSFWKKP
jgi:hypothetical protein